MRESRGLWAWVMRPMMCASLIFKNLVVNSTVSQTWIVQGAEIFILFMKVFHLTKFLTYRDAGQKYNKRQKTVIDKFVPT